MRKSRKSIHRRRAVRPYEAALTDGFSAEQEKIIRRWLVSVAIEANME